MTRADRTLKVNLGQRSYDIHIGQSLIADIASLVPVKLKDRTAFIVTDINVEAPHANAIEKALSGNVRAVHKLVLGAGEQTKSFAKYEDVLNWMLENGVDRHAILFAVGGGVIGDLGGFAAATALRGIPFVQVPTTLLAQVDSSVGGKTGINTAQGKNLVGSFYQPISVVCDMDTLKTLPRRELLAGYAEIAKYGLIVDAPFFEWLEKHGSDVVALKPDALARAVEVSCKTKAEIVSADERESGQRMLLNLGHTFAHVLEAAAGYDGTLLHGEAVSIGMVLAFRLSARLGYCKPEDATRVKKHLAGIGLRTEVAEIKLSAGFGGGKLTDMMRHDKKVAAGKLTFILAKGIGKTFVTQDVAREDVVAVIEESQRS